MKRHHYGTPKTAKDGIKYRSTFEANFVDKYLYGKNIKYEYEKKYPGSRQKCDFYLTDLDIWIELVYHGVEVKCAYQEIGKKVYLPDATYHDRNYIKSFGGRWDPKQRKWYIIYLGENLLKLEKFMDEESLGHVLHSDGKSLSEEYDKNLSRKIALQHSLLVITHDDMRRSSIDKIIFSKGSKSCNFKLVSKYFKDLNEQGSKQGCHDLEVISEGR